MIRALIRGGDVYKNIVVSEKDRKAKKVIKSKSSLVKIAVLGIAEEGFFLSF